MSLQKQLDAVMEAMNNSAVATVLQLYDAGLLARTNPATRRDAIRSVLVDGLGKDADIVDKALDLFGV